MALEMNDVLFNPDLISIIFCNLPLHTLILCKRVNSHFAKIARRTVATQHWQRRLGNREALTRCPVRFERYVSAKEAFASLNAAAAGSPRVDRRLVRRMCQTMRQRFKLKSRFGTKSWRGDCDLFETQLRIFCRSSRFVQQCGYQNIVVFADVENSETSLVLDNFATQCSKFGLQIGVFEKFYPPVRRWGGFNPPSGHHSGYTQIFYGKLMGFVFCL